MKHLTTLDMRIVAARRRRPGRCPGKDRNVEDAVPAMQLPTPCALGELLIQDSDESR